MDGVEGGGPQRAGGSLGPSQTPPAGWDTAQEPNAPLLRPWPRCGLKPWEGTQTGSSRTSLCWQTQGQCVGLRVDGGLSRQRAHVWTNCSLHKTLSFLSLVPSGSWRITGSSDLPSEPAWLSREPAHSRAPPESYLAPPPQEKSENSTQKQEHLKSALSAFQRACLAATWGRSPQSPSGCSSSSRQRLSRVPRELTRTLNYVGPPGSGAVAPEHPNHPRFRICRAPQFRGNSRWSQPQ